MNVGTGATLRTTSLAGAVLEFSTNPKAKAQSVLKVGPELAECAVDDIVGARKYSLGSSCCSSCLVPLEKKSLNSPSQPFSLLSNEQFCKFESA